MQCAIVNVGAKVEVEVSVEEAAVAAAAPTCFRLAFPRPYTCVSTPVSVFHTNTAPLAPEASRVPSGEKLMRSIGSV